MGQDGQGAGRDRVLKSYRRFLIDIHVPDWDAEFMSKMDPDELVGRVAGAGARRSLRFRPTTTPV